MEDATLRAMYDDRGAEITRLTKRLDERNKELEQREDRMIELCQEYEEGRTKMLALLERVRTCRPLLALHDEFDAEVQQMIKEL